MTHGILTNQFTAEFNFRNIDRDFDIFMVTKESSKLDRTNVLDVPTVEWKALAVQYTYGRHAFVLFKKGTVDEMEFRLSIQERFPGVTVKKVDVFDEAFRKDHFYTNDRLLAQLLLNSLKVPRSEKFGYHNLTGKLYYTDHSWTIKDKATKKIIMFYTLEVKLHPGMYLKLHVRTFKRQLRRSGKREYIFDSKTKQLRKKLRDDEQGEVFVEGSLKGKHNTVPYLDFSSITQYQKCKLGILHHLLEEVREKLGEYMTLTPQSVKDVNAYEIPKAPNQTSDNLQQLIHRPLCIIDEARTERSAAMVEKIADELETYYGITPVFDEWNPDAYHIRLIHNEDYYVEHQLADPHDTVPRNMIVQHMTEEEEIKAAEKNGKQKKASPAITKVLQELLIKEDIIQGRITLYNWEEHHSEQEWTFVIRDKIKSRSEEKPKTHMNTAGDYVYEDYLYTMMTISTGGRIVFRQFQDNSEYLSGDYGQIIRTFERFQKENRRIDNEVEGLVFSSLDNIHAIIRTPRTTMPDIDTVWKGLDETNPKALVNKEHLYDALKEFEIECPEYQDYANYLRHGLEEAPQDVSKEMIKRIMDYRHYRNAAIAWNRFLHNNFGVWIMPEMKHRDMENDYHLENVLDIKYYQSEDEWSKNAFFYFVGTKRTALQTSIHNACIIRRVNSSGEENEFIKLLPLMAVDFIRTNQYTVIPFPFKYLREYAAMQNNDSEASSE